jgi:hypothetical protein
VYRPNNGLQRAVVVAVLAWTVLIIGGMIYTLAYRPASDLDRKCLKSSLAEIQVCINDYKQGR